MHTRQLIISVTCEIVLVYIIVKLISLLSILFDFFIRYIVSPRQCTFSGKLEKKKKRVTDEIQELGEILEKSTASEIPELFVPVPFMEDIKMVKEAMDSKWHVGTSIVCGPREVGKPTAMQKAFEGEQGVIVFVLIPALLTIFIRQL